MPGHLAEHGVQRTGFVEFQNLDLGRLFAPDKPSERQRRSQHVPQGGRQRDGAKIGATSRAGLALLTIDIGGLLGGELPLVDERLPENRPEGERVVPTHAAFSRV